MFYVVLLITVALCAIAAVLSAVETAVMVLPPGRVHRLVEAEARGADELDRLAARPYRLRAASALAFGLACASAALFGVVAGGLLPDIGGLLAQVVAVVVFVLVTFSLVGALPRALAVANPERVGLDAALPARLASAVLYPVARVLRRPVDVDRAGCERRASRIGVGDGCGVPLGRCRRGDRARGGGGGTPRSRLRLRREGRTRGHGAANGRRRTARHRHHR